MRLARLKLRNPDGLWILNPIILDEDKLISQIIDVDKLSDTAKIIIDNSSKIGDILICSEDCSKVYKSIELVNTVQGEVKFDDNEYDEEDAPKIISITEEQDEATTENEIEEDYYKKAKILLSNNGHTVKACIDKLEDKKLLAACFEIETENKARKVVLDSIRKKILVK